MKSSSFQPGAWQIIVRRNEVLQPDSSRENLTKGQLLKKGRIAEVGKRVLLFFFFKRHSKVWIWGIDGHDGSERSAAAIGARWTTAGWSAKIPLK